ARVSHGALAADDPPLPPLFAFVKTTRWKDVDADAQEAFAELVSDLGARVEEVELSAAADEGLRWQEAISGAEMARNLAREWETGRDRLSTALRSRIERVRAVSAVGYPHARAALSERHASFTEMFEQRYDAIIPPTASGTAPTGLESTG